MALIIATRPDLLAALVPEQGGLWPEGVENGLST
jgi:hypothetical protein